MNEFIFFLQISLLVLTISWFLRLGPEALIGLSAFLSICANLFVLKQIEILGWNCTCSDSFAIAVLLITNVLQRRFGSFIATNGIIISFVAMMIFTMISQLHLWYRPSSFDTNHPHFFALLQPHPRILLASLIAFLVSQCLELRLTMWFQKFSKKISWKSQAFLSISLSQAIDTMLFTILGLYQVVTNLTSVFLVSYSLKSISLFIFTFLLGRLMPLFTKKT